VSSPKKNKPVSQRYLPTMTQDYSRISDTAKAVDSIIWPKIVTYLQSIVPQIERMSEETPFLIADYGAADGVNSSELFENIINQIHAINPSLSIKLVYIDIASHGYFDTFWKNSRLAQSDLVQAEYIQRSFYEPFPEIAHNLNIGFSSTSVHWLDTINVDFSLYRHPEHIQANQLPDIDRRRFVKKWEGDWEVFLRERSVELIEGGALFLANLADFGHNQFPASAGYDNLRDACSELYREGHISDTELKAIMVPDYFATPEEMKSVLNKNDLKHVYSLVYSDEMTVPCAYFSRVKNQLDNEQVKAELADTLAHVVRAWSESSIKTGLAPENKGKIDEIYQRLRQRFYETPQGLPYQYCLLELIKR
jgi:hypothetical protein